MMYVKLPVAAFELQISAAAIKVYCGLLACANSQGKAVVRQGRLGELCHISRSTVAAAVQELTCAGLCSVENQYKQDGTYRANSYTLAILGGRWIAMPITALVMELPSSAFMVYAAMLSFRGRKGYAFPSLRRIQAMLGLARNTVIRAIRQLCSCGLLRKRSMWAGKHNLYIVVLLRKTKRMSAPAGTRNAQTHSSLVLPINTISVPLTMLFVKIFPSQRVVQFSYNKPIPTQLLNIRKSYSSNLVASMGREEGRGRNACRLSVHRKSAFHRPRRFFFCLGRSVFTKALRQQCRKRRKRYTGCCQSWRSNAWFEGAASDPWLYRCIL